MGHGLGEWWLSSRPQSFHGGDRIIGAGSDTHYLESPTAPTTRKPHIQDDGIITGQVRDGS